MDTGMIPARQAANLSITFTGLPGRREYATFASVVTDEVGPSKYDLPVKGKIRQDFVLEPETLLFGKVKKGDARVLETTVRRRDGAAFSLKEVRCPRAEFASSWKEVEAGKQNLYRIKVDFKAVRSGNLTEVATLLTDAPPEVSPQLTLSADVESEFAVEPQIALARIGVDGKVEGFEIVIRHLNGGSVQIESVREGRSLPVEFIVQEKGASHSKVRIRLTEDLPSGAPFGEFLITTSGHSDEPIHLPYRIETPPSKSPGNP
jgi:hypothetical protein